LFTLKVIPKVDNPNNNPNTNFNPNFNANANFNANPNLNNNYNTNLNYNNQNMNNNNAGNNFNETQQATPLVSQIELNPEDMIVLLKFTDVKINKFNS